MNHCAPKPSKWLVSLVLVIGVMAVSAAAIFIRLCQETAGLREVGFSLFIAASRLMVAATILLPTYPSLTTVRVGKSAYYYTMAAGICLALHVAAWITSLAFTSIAASTILVTTNPLWIALMAWLWWQERPKQKRILGILISILGGIIIALSDKGVGVGSNPLGGDLLALMGSWMASGYFLLGREAQRQGLTLNQYVAIAYLTAAVCLFPLPLIFGASYLGYPYLVYVYIILMAIVSQLIGHTSLNWALRWVSPTIVALVILFEPISSSLLAVWLFGEIPSLSVLLGGLIVMMGVAIAVVSR
jgi:drug/metabolite transporter (DMT)-like permease